MVTTKVGPRPYWVHLVWTFYVFMNIAMFWWWEFRLGTIAWSLSIYLVVITYATLLFFISLLVQPSNLAGIDDYKEYYYSRRQWIFGLLIAISLWDFVDSWFGNRIPDHPDIVYRRMCIGKRYEKRAVPSVLRHSLDSCLVRLSVSNLLRNQLVLCPLLAERARLSNLTSW